MKKESGRIEGEGRGHVERGRKVRVEKQWRREVEG